MLSDLQIKALAFANKHKMINDIFKMALVHAEIDVAVYIYRNYATADHFDSEELAGIKRFFESPDIATLVELNDMVNEQQRRAASQELHSELANFQVSATVN